MLRTKNIRNLWQVPPHIKSKLVRVEQRVGHSGKPFFLYPAVKRLCNKNFLWGFYSLTSGATEVLSRCFITTNCSREVVHIARVLVMPSTGT